MNNEYFMFKSYSITSYHWSSTTLYNTKRVNFKNLTKLCNPQKLSQLHIYLQAFDPKMPFYTCNGFLGPTQKSGAIWPNAIFLNLLLVKTFLNFESSKKAMSKLFLKPLITFCFNEVFMLCECEDHTRFLPWLFGATENI